MAVRDIYTRTRTHVYAEVCRLGIGIATLLLFLAPAALPSGDFSRAFALRPAGKRTRPVSPIPS